MSGKGSILILQSNIVEQPSSGSTLANKTSSVIIYSARISLMEQPVSDVNSYIAVQASLCGPAPRASAGSQSCHISALALALAQPPDGGCNAIKKTEQQLGTKGRSAHYHDNNQGAAVFHYVNVPHDQDLFLR